MSSTRRAPSHRRPRKTLAFGVPPALAAAGILAYGSVFGLGLGEEGRAAAAGAPAAATAADGFASVNALGRATATATSSLTVAQDGTGQYRTVQAAVNAVPVGNPSRTVISVKPGTYRETVNVPANKPHLTIQGSDARPTDTVLVYGNAAGMRKPDGSGTYGTPGSATVALRSDGSRLRNLTVANDFDEAAHQSLKDHQAVALLTTADKIVLDGLVVTGDQDTLELETAAKDKPGRVHVTNSSIAGNVDFIFGRATAVIDRSVVTLKKRWNGTSAGYITAPSTQAGRKGILINRSTINGDVNASSFYLGRNWHPGGDRAADPQATVRDSRLSAAIKRTPWTGMGGFPWKDDRFAEYMNTGPGAGPKNTDRPHLTDSQAVSQEVSDWLGDWTP